MEIGSAVAAGAAGFDDAGGEQVVEPIGDERRQKGGELVGSRGGAGFVEMDELVGFEAEDFAEVGAVAPGADEVADPGEGVAAILEAADQLQAEHPDAARSVAMAKYQAVIAGGNVIDNAVQLMGGSGFVEESDVARHYRDARILRIGGGADEVQLEILAKKYTARR